MKKHANIPIFIADRGCPNHCVFCNQKNITDTKDETDLLRAQKIIEEALSTIKGREAEIAFFGGSFSGLDAYLQEDLLALADSYQKMGQVLGIRLSTRPDLINDEVIDRFKRHHVTCVELGCQSMDNTVLDLNQRGHTSEDTRCAAKKIKEAGFRLGLQMMTGLIGDSFEKSLYTVREIIKLSPDETRIYPMLVIRGTKLEALYQEGHYVPISLDEAVERCACFLPMFEEAGIKVLRMGLMASEGLRFDTDLVAGPYHSAFGELVESLIMKNHAVELLEANGGNCRLAVIYVSPKSLSKMIGNRKKNILYLKACYPQTDIKILPDAQLSGREITICCT